MTHLSAYPCRSRAAGIVFGVLLGIGCSSSMGRNDSGIIDAHLGDRRADSGRQRAVDVVIVMEPPRSTSVRSLPLDFAEFGRALAAADADHDDVPDVDAHVGVITTDLGTDGGPSFGECMGWGDDGLMVVGSSSGAPCFESPPRFIDGIRGPAVESIAC